IAIRASSDRGWSTSSNRVLSDCTISGPSVTQPVLHLSQPAYVGAGSHATLPLRMGWSTATTRTRGAPYEPTEPASATGSLRPAATTLRAAATAAVRAAAGGAVQRAAAAPAVWPAAGWRVPARADLRGAAAGQEEEHEAESD